MTGAGRSLAISCGESARCVTLGLIPTYLRFVVAEIHENSAKELGVFHAVLRLREEGKLLSHEEELHDVTRQWFSENLEKPTRFTASKPPFYRRPNKAISWFKDSARDHLAHIRGLRIHSAGAALCLNCSKGSELFQEVESRSRIGSVVI
jgi:hypothetical protein